VRRAGIAQRPLPALVVKTHKARYPSHGDVEAAEAGERDWASPNSQG